MKTRWTRTVAGSTIAALCVSAPALRGAELSGWRPPVGGAAAVSEVVAAPDTPSAPSPPAGDEAKEGEDAKPKPPKVTADGNGFAIESGDGSFQLRLRTLLQSDARFYFGDSDTKPDDDFLMRRARLELTGKLFGKFDFRLMPDFAPANQTLLDAWLRWLLSPALQVQAGKVKMPVSLEREQTREYNLLSEFGYPTSLAPNRDIGLNVQGQVLDGALAYYVGGFNGTADGQSVISDTDDGKSVVARLFLTPTDGPLEGLGIGAGATLGEQEGIPAAYRTVGQQIFYRFRSDVLTDGTVSRLFPHAYFFKGPFGAMAEHGVSSQEVVRAGVAADELENTAWHVTASWVLTGEDATYRGVEPDRDVDLEGGGWGAWQVVGRVTELDVDDDAFPVFADPVVSAARARSYTFGVNWYLNRQVRCVVDYSLTELDGFAGVRFADEKALITRVQLRF
jgi:phosphate-selective porin OprO/OprP